MGTAAPGRCYSTSWVLRITRSAGRPGLPAVAPPLPAASQSGQAADEREDGPSSMRSDQGILVTGLPRSGTSWIGKMLQAGGEVVYVNEPLNPQHPPGRSPGVLNAEVTHRYQYICAENDERWAAAYHDTLRLRYQLIAELRRNRAPYDLARMAKYSTAFTIGRLRRPSRAHR